MERIEFTELPDKRWRWCFLDTSGRKIYSNDIYPDLTEAKVAAKAAYPDLDVSHEQGSGDNSA